MLFVDLVRRRSPFVVTDAELDSMFDMEQVLDNSKELWRIESCDAVKAYRMKHASKNLCCLVLGRKLHVYRAD
jgi:hypothetical protein